MKEICDGKIDQRGFCEKCYQVSQVTSGYCTRLIDVAPKQNMESKTAEKSAIDYAKINMIRQIEEMINSKWGSPTGDSYIQSHTRSELAQWIYELTEQMKLNLLGLEQKYSKSVSDEYIEKASYEFMNPFFKEVTDYCRRGHTLNGRKMDTYQISNLLGRIKSKLMESMREGIIKPNK